MPREFYAALCLVLVIEGLVLFAVPHGWQAMMREALKLDPRTLRLFGALAIGLGLVTLHWIH
ncbi:DUF2065 domain-containing protein [Dyella caseinilytica]|uniref:DUF2065 domain-containing protein n=1 Tax=Dyella caseinilytica TaxID=1849581 RepID=A0ABX7GPK9_9GAMM|nr:DUF2065 domain-containing protein [Dyella caseinilytica]QRN52357.1 DUF2065 domain-containing protein [Dyella caseinilytica]GGA15055.1 hypothetical protein GCM10011408_41310 [Dyella caseinilytica]